MRLTINALPLDPDSTGEPPCPTCDDSFYDHSPSGLCYVETCPVQMLLRARNPRRAPTIFCEDPRWGTA